MKHCYRLFAAALMVVLSTLVFTGCNKNEDPADEALKQGEATLARIMNFKQQVDYYKTNPDVKDGESVTLDEAIWNIEALFNLTYAYPELSYGRTETADTVLYLPVGSDNTVLLTDLTVFYGQMYEVVRNIYQGIELDKKQFLILDVEAGDLHGSQQAIKLHSIQGSVKGTPSTPPTPPQNGPFPPGVLWCYGEKGGNNTNNDLYGKKDAADTLSGTLNAFLVQRPPVNCEYFYTEPIIIETQIGEHHDFPQSIFPDITPRYCEFYIENPTENDKWMDANRMNYHYFAERYLVLVDLPSSEIPSNHVLFEVTVDDYMTNFPYTIGHLTTACYGYRNIIGHNSIVKENLQ